MTDPLSRRTFLYASASGAALSCTAPRVLAAADQLDFQISLNESSLMRSLSSGRLNHLDLAQIAREQFDIAAIEYLSRCFRKHVQDKNYLKEMNKRAADHDVRQLLIMVDGEGRFDAPDREERRRALRNHRKWIDAAEALGCHSIEVDTPRLEIAKEQLGPTAEAVRTLCEYAEQHHIGVLLGCRNGQRVEPDFIMKLIQHVDHPACGVLPGFTELAAAENVERVTRLVALAKAISATARDFDAQGRETRLDFFRIMSAVLASGYRGYVGIAYRGEILDEVRGIRATKALLENARQAG